MYKSLDPEELCALYSVADACLISSTRDGLNMVSYEYIACQAERNGVLVLSQYAGAAKMLPSALLINPWDASCPENPRPSRHRGSGECLLASPPPNELPILPDNALLTKGDQTPRFAEAIEKALLMPLDERVQRREKAAQIVDEWTR